MQASTDSPAINTATANTTTVTKSQEQILIQSSGAMIAIIVIGIIIILTVLLIILKTYNRRTHVSRVLGTSTKPRAKTPQSSAQSNVPLTPIGISSISGSISFSNPPSENGFRLTRAEQGSPDQSSRSPSENSFRLPRVELSSVDENVEESSAASTVVTIHELAVMENT
ncbi:noncompact myelin-associated protein [Eucyclogobius newberryi]|uniref:noncompact myelin-associated protein n=1 Tax=Eucyclogobius newberryi TaxID=166745 RepID=UPI003B5A0735